jgi:hypothetical protein
VILKSNCRALVMFINSKVNSSGDNSMSVGHITSPVMSKSLHIQTCYVDTVVFG